MQQIEMNFVKVAEVFTGRGPQNAKTAREIAKILNCSIRDVTAMVNQERREGYPILANTSGEHAGYYLAETREQVYGFCGGLEHRAKEMHKTKKALMKALKDLPSEADIAGRQQPPPAITYRP